MIKAQQCHSEFLHSILWRKEPVYIGVRGERTHPAWLSYWWAITSSFWTRAHWVCLTNFIWRRSTFEFKVSRDVFVNKKMKANWHIHLFLGCHLNLWVIQYFRKIDLLNYKNTVLICNKKGYQSSISMLRSRMFLRMLKVGHQLPINPFDFGYLSNIIQ